MENILNIIQHKNPEDITDREFSAFQGEIEAAIRHVNRLQIIHRSFTGTNYVPPVRLKPKKEEADGD